MVTIRTCKSFSKALGEHLRQVDYYSQGAGNSRRHELGQCFAATDSHGSHNRACRHYPDLVARPADAKDRRRVESRNRSLRRILRSRAAFRMQRPVLVESGGLLLLR